MDDPILSRPAGGLLAPPPGRALPRWHYPAALLAGAANTLSFAPTPHGGWLQLVVFVWFFAALDLRNRVEHRRLGWCEFSVSHCTDARILSVGRESSQQRVVLARDVERRNVRGARRLNLVDAPAARPAIRQHTGNTSAREQGGKCTTIDVRRGES